MQALGLPSHKGSGRLAIVGGGNSINKHVEELRNWDGAIWAVNGTINWCLDHGIEAYFYTIDAQPLGGWVYPLDRVTKAALATDCDPNLIKSLVYCGVEVSLLPIPDGGPTSACAADLLSIQAGYTNVTWFGCEGDFGETTHAYISAPIVEWIDVDVGPHRFRTKPEFAIQAALISEVIRTFPQVYSERSGGMLAAMVEHGPEYDVYQVAKEIYARMQGNAA